MPPRVLIAGFGDTGLLVAIHLGVGFEVVGVSPKPCLVSGQELGTRLTRPQEWKRDYLMGFDRYEKLDGVRTVHGIVDRIDLASREAILRDASGAEETCPYDVLVLSSGVTNGFWRDSRIGDLGSIDGEIDRVAHRIAAAGRVAIVGGGATGVSVAANLAETDPNKQVHLFFAHDLPLPDYHPKTRAHVVRRLERAGVHLHPGHRARIPVGFACDRLTTDPVEWSTGQDPFAADLTLWAVGAVRPNNDFIPAELLDDDGFVRAGPTLQVPGHPEVFTVGDIAATDPLRSSARNWGHQLAAHNIRAHLAGKPGRMKRYRPPKHRWGSILGVQKEGLRVFQPGGGSFRFPRWAVRRLLWPFAVHRAIYRGVRAPRGN